LTIIAVSAIGFFLSIYAFSVMKKVRRDQSYTPFCDISSSVSCSRAFASRYGVTLGIPNPLAGIFYYSLVAAVSGLKPGWLLFLVIPALAVTVYLAVISYVVQRNFCLVCSAVYVVNLVLAIIVFSG
jgi:uncharacterized membrane protein